MTPVWDDRVAGWVAAHIPDCERGFGECRALGVVNHNGELVAGVVFHEWNPERGLIELSAAATDRRWLTRTVANIAMGYAFSVARMAVVRTDERNMPVRRLWKALGVVEHVIPDMWAPGVATIIITLTLEQWQKSRLCNEQAQGARAA